MFDFTKNMSESLIIPPDARERFIFFNHFQNDETYRRQPVIAGLSDIPTGGYLVRLQACTIHQILLVREGILELLIDGNIQVMKEGEMIFLHRDYPHIYGAGHALKFLWFHLSPERLQLPKEMALKIRPSNYFSEIVNLAELLYREERRNPAKAVHTAASLMEYVRQDLNIPPPGNRYQKRMNELFDLVNADLQRHWTIRELARKIYMSESNFYLACKAVYDLSPYEILTKIRMERAASLLLRSDYDLNVIAAQIGYADSFTFSKAFKRYYQCSPKSFRRRG